MTVNVLLKMFTKIQFSFKNKMYAKILDLTVKIDGWIEGTRMKWMESGTEIITIKKSDGVVVDTPVT